MDIGDLLNALRQFLDIKLFEISGTSVTVSTALTALLIVLVTLWLSRSVRRSLERILRARGITDESTVGTFSSLLNYVMLIAGFTIALQTLGIDLSTLFAAGAIFAVGLGFAMQNIVENFVSGVILISERSVRPGDILEVEGMLVRVVKTGVRATIVRNLDGADLILPNSILVQSPVQNYTLQDSLYRLRTTVGVVYSADMALVRATLEAVLKETEWALQDPQPQVAMVEFGDNAVIYEVAFWMQDPWQRRRALSDINEAVWWAFQEHQIEIAFPQLDVHFDPPVGDGLSKLAATPQ